MSICLVFAACTSIGDSPLAGVDSGITTPDAGPTADAGPQSVTLSHSTDPATVTAANSIACVQQQDDGNGNIVPVFHQTNSYYRLFDLLALGVSRDLAVDQVSFGIESADAGAAAEQTIEVHLHTVSGPFQLANMTAIGSAQVTVANQTETLIDLPITAVVPANASLAVELRIPTGDPDRLLFIGSNTNGQSGPTFLRAPDCDDDADPMTPTAFLEPVDLGGLFPNMHLLLSVSGIF